MKTHIASDIHLNHRNILNYCPHRQNEKTVTGNIQDSDIHWMNEKIISNWNSVVDPDDEVWILGDVAMGQMEKAPALIRRMNGKKHLVIGNHDKTLVRNIKRGDEDFQGLFESYHPYYELSYQHTVTGKKHMLVLSHYPISHWNSMNQGIIHLHGHLHGSPSGLTGRIKDVGIDTNNLFPYELDGIITEMTKIDVIRNHHND